MFRNNDVYDGRVKPKRFERDMIVAGAGSGGLVSACIGAHAGDLMAE